MKFRFELQKTDERSKARRGRFTTSHGTVETPIFMPVGTMAAVKTLSAAELEAIGAQIILGNTYHLLLRPGPEVFRHFGGIHRFMGWKRPVLTDSGGFQIFSLPRSRRLTEEGAVFQSYVQGHEYKLTPETSIEMQNAIGSDIMMVLDQCIESTADHKATKAAMELTHRWAARSLAAHKNPDQALFGIVQGGVHEDLRYQSVDVLTQMPFDGFAIGGLAVGETKSQREDFCELVADRLPADKPRYLMGVGTPVDLLEAVKRGVDMFDCIIPTKLAQQGIVFTSRGQVKLQQTAFKLSDDRIDPDCACPSCEVYSRGYLHHLIKCREVLGWRALALHNINFYLRLMEDVRRSIEESRFSEFYRESLSRWEENAGDSDGSLAAEAFREPPVFGPPPRKPKGYFIES